MIEAEKELYCKESVVEIVRLYWQILATKSALYDYPEIHAQGMLSAIDDYKKRVPKEIQEKITFENLKGLERLCHKHLNDKKESK